MMKITRSTTVEQLKDFLNANYTMVRKKNKDLADTIKYAGKKLEEDPKSVKKADLAELAKNVISLLGDKVKEVQTPTLKVVAENSTKPSNSKLKSTGKEDKKVTKKEDAKEASEKKETTTKNPKSKKEEKELKSEIPLATSDCFPEEIKVGDEIYLLARDIKDMNDLYECMSKEEDILFAYYWSKRHLKQFAYFGDWLGKPKSFDSDLDLAAPLHISDEKKVAYQISIYTEAMYTLLPGDFDEVDGIRCAGGIEFQIYRAK